MWSEYIVQPFSGAATGKHRRKQAALEDAQNRAINKPGEMFTVYRAEHYPDSGMCDLITIIRYYFDETINKLQHTKG